MSYNHCCCLGHAIDIRRFGAGTSVAINLGMKAFVLLPALLLTLLTSHVFAQTPSDKLSADESREAQKLAHTFARRLLRTKDLAPLVDDYLVRDFLNGYLQDTDRQWLAFLDRDVAKQMSRAELRRYFIAELNWFYLCELYVFSKYTFRFDSDVPLEKLYPADVLRVFRSDPRTRATLGNNDVADSELMIGTVAEMRSFVKRLETASRLLRKHARRINAGHTRHYRETLVDWTDRYQLYEPWLTVCEQTCMALPKGTRLIGIAIPSIELQFTKVNGRLRIVSAWFLID